MSEVTALEKARDLVQVLDWMRENGNYGDRAALDRMEGLHAALRPAYFFFFGGFPLINAVTYPPNVWFPRIWERARQLLAHLEANPDWVPGDAIIQPAQDGWIPSRLLEYIGGSLQHARQTNSPTDWGKVSRDAILFFEDELRARDPALAEIKDRHNLAGRAFNPTDGTFVFKKKPAIRQGWMNYVQGMFAIFGNPTAHTIRQHSESYAMGVVGAVSTLLVLLDEEVGPPPGAV